MTSSIDAFNIFNEGYVLSRNTNLNSGSADWVNATLSPRIFRLGVRVNWR
jgi:outer membrane receptor protein involved in Fe transport